MRVLARELQVEDSADTARFSSAMMSYSRSSLDDGLCMPSTLADTHVECSPAMAGVSPCLRLQRQISER